MDAKQFLAEFEHIANAPGGVQRLRELILQLAISGKLVDQLTSEGTSDLCVKEAAVNKKTYEEQLKLRKSKLISPLLKHEIPHVIPNYWEWERLDNIACYIQRGKGPKYNDLSKQFVISQKCVKWTGFDLLLARGVDEESLEKYGKERFLKGGDLLWNSTGTGTAGRVCVYPLNENTVAVADSHVTVIRLTNFVPKYIWCVIAAPSIQSRFKPEHENSLVTGTTNQVELSTSAVKSLAVPCPPVEEQKRIVAKVDELMKLCDKLEVQQQNRNKLKNLTHTTLLDALGNAQSPYELKTAWQRVQEALPFLYTDPEDVWIIKQTIIDLAMSGYLIENSEKSKNTGSALLGEIEQARLTWEAESKAQELKEAQLMRKKLNKQKYDIPNRSLPENWAWGSFLQISQTVVDCHNKTAPYVLKGVHLIRTTDIRNGKMDLRNTKKITEETYEYWARRMPPKEGDIFFTREAPMGEAAIVPLGEKVCLGQRTLLIRLFSKYFDNEFLLYAIYSPSFIARMEGLGVGATVQHLRVGGVEDLIVPVPPIDEQRTIVKKLHGYELTTGYSIEILN